MNPQEQSSLASNRGDRSKWKGEMRSLRKELQRREQVGLCLYFMHMCMHACTCIFMGEFPTLIPSSVMQNGTVYFETYIHENKDAISCEWTYCQ